MAVASFPALAHHGRTPGGVAVPHPATGRELPALFVPGEIIWLSAGAAAALTLCICPLMQPYGRGWKPALWAFGIMLIPVVLIALQFAGGGGGE